MVAKFEESKKYESSQNELMQSAKIALEKCNFKVKSINENEGQITAKTKLSWWSWTENNNLKIEEDGTVSMKSKSSFPLQIFDWGKNKRNVKSFFNELRS